MGGIKFSPQGQVLTQENVPILGLWAAGEVTGGLHGENRLGGNSLLECVVFGRRVGKNASAYRRTPGIMHRPPEFYDKMGVFHGVALDPNEWRPLKLRERIQLNKFNHLFRFDLPSPTHHLGLRAGQYLALRANIGGQETVRYYSPVTQNSTFGNVDLIIKIEMDKTQETSMTRHLFSLQAGQTLEFKGPLGGFEYHRNTYRELGLIAGGTGISPMIQIIRSVSNHPEDKTKVSLLYGNFLEDDILCRDELMYYTATRDNIKAFITLSDPPPHWKMGVGFITEEMMKNHLPAPAADIKIVLCGPPGMIKAMIPTLKKLGYTDEMIFSYI